MLRLCFVTTKNHKRNLLRVIPGDFTRPSLSPTGGGASGGGGGRRSAGFLDAVQAAAAQPDRVSVQAAQKGDGICDCLRRYDWGRPGVIDEDNEGGAGDWKAAPETLEKLLFII